MSSITSSQRKINVGSNIINVQLQFVTHVIAFQITWVQNSDKKWKSLHFLLHAEKNILCCTCIVNRNIVLFNKIALLSLIANYWCTSANVIAQWARSCDVLTHKQTFASVDEANSFNTKKFYT